jgi:hypothetical protein
MVIRSGLAYVAKVLEVQRNKATKKLMSAYEQVETGGVDAKPLRAGVTLEWCDVRLQVGSGDKEKVLLHTMGGIARPQQMLAVMGSSGAGMLIKNS